MARITRSDIFCRTQSNCIFTECTAAAGRQLTDQPSSLSDSDDPRRMLIKDQILLFSQYFAIDLITFSMDSKCLRQLLRSKPQLAEQFSPHEVARRWLIVCPSVRRHAAPLHQPSEQDINQLCDDPDRIETIRWQLGDVAWWHRLLCQRIAQDCNRRDKLPGPFWAGRYHSILLPDTLSLLLCQAFIDTSSTTTTTTTWEQVDCVHHRNLRVHGHHN
jgi:hypothetical protein